MDKLKETQTRTHDSGGMLTKIEPIQNTLCKQSFLAKSIDSVCVCEKTNVFFTH